VQENLTLHFGAFPSSPLGGGRTSACPDP